MLWCSITARETDVDILIFYSRERNGSSTLWVFWFSFAERNCRSTLRIFWFPVSGRGTAGFIASILIYYCRELMEYIVKILITYCRESSWRNNTYIANILISYCRERNWQSTLRIFWFPIAGRGTDGVHCEYSDFLCIAGRGTDRVHCEYPRRRKTRLQDSYSTYIYLPVSTRLS
jgi:hypothetical protein